ncbi:HAD-IIB family hydrolase [Candidatus Gracilibacteria bacterium]|nr:HAD-IIB family hydrolase [Candidatus Gracilibacteria bacterium]
MKSLIIFDLDDTLAESKSAILPNMAIALRDLLQIKKVAIITGGKYEQIIKQVVSNLPKDANLSNLYLFPTCGASYYHFIDGVWINVYEERLSPEDVKKIFQALRDAQKSAGVITDGSLYGEQTEDRRTQVSWSALGQQCPPVLKVTWDPDQQKRLSMLPFLNASIPEYEVRIGGATTIDVTRKGVDKKYGIYQMEKYLGVPLADMLFIGDAIFPGGNDYAAVEAGIHYEKTTGPDMTHSLIENIIKLG